MEITNEIAKKVILQYVDCKVIFGYEGHEKKGNLEGYTEPFGFQVQDQSNAMFIRHNVRKELLKLILKPLSSITDEDAIEVQKLIGFRANRKFKQFIEMCNATSPESAIEIYQFLQSKGYDMPHYLLGGKTLEESGLAVYE